MLLDGRNMTRLSFVNEAVPITARQHSEISVYATLGVRFQLDPSHLPRLAYLHLGRAPKQIMWGPFDVVAPGCAFDLTEKAGQGLGRPRRTGVATLGALKPHIIDLNALRLPVQRTA
ncbi:hypothetical protein K438DRAFT_1755674 [Mycena galopus ATCC 62051]|nr:hypothetical protein K438DRAFT_1755674 [Mycena galopus ATCC 62051]